ncbi:winged helix-turn-helix transcriptional regulator [Candidatus Harpocratesius sp.]
MKRKLILNVLLFMTFILSFLIMENTINLTSASSHSDFGKEQANKARSIKTDITEDLLKIESEQNSNEKNDNFEFKISLNQNEGMEIKVEYRANALLPKISSEFKIRFDTLIEFNDTNKDGKYDIDNDQIIQQISLQGIHVINQSKIEQGNISLYTFQLEDTSKIFQPTVIISSDALISQNMVILPNQLKIDLNFVNFPFTSENGLLALQISIENTYNIVEQEITEDESHNISTNEQGIKSVQADYPSYFTWTNDISVDGKQKEMKSSIFYPDEEKFTEYQLFFAYPKGNSIIHDPKIGVENTFFPSSGTDLNRNSTPIWMWIILITGLVSTVLFILYMSVPEFRQYLLNRYLPMHTAPHRLTMEEVLENEIRMNLITLILERPGIHYSELLREIDTSPSNLAWHLDILETYKIIQKQRLGKYLIFYPYLDKNPFANLDPTIAKSKTTLEILKIIGENPGIYQGKIAKRLDLNRKSVQYHLDKLEELKLIRREKLGRKVLLYQN